MRTVKTNMRTKMRKRRVNEGGGAGVEFDFNDVEINHDYRDWETFTIDGKLILRSYMDASIVETEGAGLLGSGILLEEDVRRFVSEEFEYLRGQDDIAVDWDSVEVSLSGNIESTIHGAGFSRSRFSGDLEVMLGADVEFQTTDGEWHSNRGEVAGFIQFHPTVKVAYEALDDPDRYIELDYDNEPILDEDGEPVLRTHIDDEDRTFYIFERRRR